MNGYGAGEPMALPLPIKLPQPERRATGPVDPELVCRWIETRRVTQGPRAGLPFELLDWERRFILDALRPGVRQAALSVGRGNGKTTVVAALAAAFVAGPLRQPRAEAPVVAGSYQQARIAFEHIGAFLDADVSGRDWRVTDSLHWSLIEHRPTGARIRVLSSNPKRAHGLAPAMIIADEPAQWERTGGERLYAALMTSTGKVPGSRLIALGTRPENSAHWFQRLLDARDDPSIVAHCYSAPVDCDWNDPEAWLEANPSLPHMPELRDALAAEAHSARSNPAMLLAFKALRLNQGVADSGGRDRLIEPDQWSECFERPAPERTGRYVLGVDLGGSAALSAAAAYWPDGGRLEVRAQVGDRPSLADRGAHDGAGDLYVQANAAGELHLSDGRLADVEDLVAGAVADWGEPAAVVFDRWREAELLDAAERHMRRSEPVLRGQGYKDGSDDVRRFRAAVMSGHVRPARRFLLLEAGIGEAVCVSDPAGNVKLAKAGEGDKRARARDDVAAAAVLAVAHGRRVVENNNGRAPGGAPLIA